MFWTCNFSDGSQGLGPMFAISRLLNGLPEAKFVPGFNARFITELFDKYKIRLGTRCSAIFTNPVTLIGMIPQCLSPRGTYREGTSTIAWLLMRWGGKTIETNSGSAFQRARMALPNAMLEELMFEIVARTAAYDAKKYGDKREIILLDGTTFTLADTEKKQKRFPQPTVQKEGSGFPIPRALFLVMYYTDMKEAMTNNTNSGKETGENARFRSIVHKLRANQILVADALHCCYWQVAWCLERGVDVVIRLHRGREASMDNCTPFEPGDTEWRWSKPEKPDWMNETDYQKLPPRQ